MRPFTHRDYDWTGAKGAPLSSFIKRRLALVPSSQAIGLDQIPESLFPLLACRQLGMTAANKSTSIATRARESPETKASPEECYCGPGTPGCAR
jgi:hypothetical protein